MSFIFDSQNGQLYIDSIKDGTIYVHPITGTNIEDFIAIVLSCFNQLAGTKRICFSYDESTITIDNPNISCNEVLELWNEECKKSNL